MAGSSIYHLNPISADTNAGTGAMAGASQSFSHAGTVFGELRKSILDEEQRKIEQDFKERQFAEAIRQFGLTDARANRIAAETERHNKAVEEYQLKNLAETANYHAASLKAQAAYHNAIIGVRNRNIDAKYGDRGSIRNTYYNYLFGEDTPSDSSGSKSTAKPPVNPASFYTPEEHALAKGMTGDKFVDFTLNDLGGVSLGSSKTGNSLLGGGSFFTGIPTPDMNVGDLATLDALPLEERMDALRRLSPDKQAELDFAAALQSGVNPFGPASNIQETPQPVQQVSLQTPETATPVQVADRGPLDHLGDFLVTPVQAGTLPPQQESKRGPETFYKTSPIGFPTDKDLEISASNFKYMDLADIDRRNTPIPLSQQAKNAIAKARQSIPSVQSKEIPWWRADTGGSEIRSAINVRNDILNQEARKNSKPIDQVINEAVQGGKPRAVMRGDRLLYETPMQRQIREQQEAERRKSDDPNIMFNINRYNFDYTDENEDYALENLHPRYQTAIRSYITDLFSAGDMTPMGNGSENSTRASVIAEKELQALKAIANLDSTSRSYATGVLKAIIARRPELMAKGRQAIAYINDYRDPRFNTTKGHISLDTHYRAEAGDNQAIKQEMEIIKETEALGKAQLAKEQKVNEFLSNPAVVTKNYDKVDSKEQTLMKDAAQIYMDTHDFKNADDQAIHALAFAMTIDDLPIERRFLGSFDPDKDRFLQLGGNRFSRFIRYSGAEDIDPDGNGIFGETFRRNLQILRRERLSGKALTNRMLSFIGYDSKKDNNK